MKPYLLGLYEKALPNEWSWEEKLTVTKETGYDFLEISIDESDMRLSRLNNPTELALIQAAIVKTGCPIKTMCLSGHRKYSLGSTREQTIKQSLQIMSDAIDLASSLGVRIIQLAGYDVYYEEGSALTRATFLTNLKHAVELAARKGIVLGFETMETPFMDTVTKSMHIVNQINSPYLHIYPDIGNLTNASKLYKHDILLDLEMGKGHLVAAHIKETKPNHYREIPFGTGHVEFEKCINTCWDMGVRMYTAEFWYDSQTNAKEIAEYNYSFITSKFPV